MIQISLTRSGAGYRIDVDELHCVCPQSCGCEPDKHSSARAYGKKGDSAKEERAAIMAALQAALKDWGHVEFLLAVAWEQEPLPGL